MPNERLKQHGEARNAREELYDVLYEDGMYPYKFSDFSAKLDNPQGRDEIFDALMAEGMWDSTREEFDKTYSNGRGRYAVGLNTGGKKYFDSKEEGDAWAKSHQATQAGAKMVQASEATNVQPTDALQEEVNGILNGEAIEAPEISEQDVAIMDAAGIGGIQAPQAQQMRSPYMKQPKVGNGMQDISAGKEAEQADRQLYQMRIDSASRRGDITPEAAYQETMRNTGSNGFAAAVDQEGNYVPQYVGEDDDISVQKQIYDQQVELQRQVRVQTLASDIDTLSSSIADLEKRHAEGLDTIKRLENEGDSTELAKIGAENAKISQELVNKRAELREKAGEFYKANGAVISKINSNLDEVENNLLDLSRRNKESVSLKNINSIKINYTDAFDALGKKVNSSKLYTLARFNIIEARNLINQADANANGQGICMGIWAGFADAVTNVKNWDFGVGEMLDYFSQRGILQKFDKQEEGNGGVGAVSHIAAKLKEGQSLTEHESLFLKSVLLKSAAEDITANALGRAYGVGRTTGEALPFMWEMYINPLGAMEDSFKKTTFGRITRGIVKKGAEGRILNAAKWLQGNTFGKKVVQNIIMDAERVGRSVGMSLTSSLPRVVGGTVKDMNGELMSGYDEQGRIQFEGVREGSEMGGVEAFFKNLYSVSKESATEMSFGPLSGAYRLGKGAASSLMEKALKTTWGKNVHNGVKDMINVLKPTEFVDNVSRFLEQTQWHGTVEEYIEEVEGNVLDAIAGLLTDGRWGDGKNFGSPDKEGSIFNVDDNIDTFLGVAFMGGVISTVKTFGYTTASREAQNRIASAERNGITVFGAESWNRTKGILDRVDAAEISKFIQDRYRYTSLNKDEIRAIADYLRAKEYASGVEAGKAQQDKQVEAAIKQTYDQTVAEEAQKEKTPEEKYIASNDLAAATEALQSIPGGQNLIDEFERLIADGFTPDQSFSKLSDALNKNEATLLDNYMRARASADSIQANIEEQLRKSEEEMMKVSPFDSEGNWITCTYNNEEYFVIGLVGNKVCIQKVVNQFEEEQPKPIMVEGNDNLYSTYVKHNGQEEMEKSRQALEQAAQEQMNNHPSTMLASKLKEGDQVNFPVSSDDATTMIVTGVDENTKTITIAGVVTTDQGITADVNNTHVYSFDEFNNKQNEYWNQHAPVSTNLTPVSVSASEESTEQQSEAEGTEGQASAESEEQPNVAAGEQEGQESEDDAQPNSSYDETTDKGSAELESKYDEIKQSHPEASVLLRSGDNFVMYGDEAEAASRVLGIPLGKTESGRSVASFNINNADDNFKKLTDAGLRLAIVDDSQPNTAANGEEHAGTEQAGTEQAGSEQAGTEEAEDVQQGEVEDENNDSAPKNESDTWHGTAYEMPVPDGIPSRSHYHLFASTLETMQNAVSKAGASIDSFNAFMDAYKEEFGSFIASQDKPFLKPYYDYLYDRLNKAATAKLEKNRELGKQMDANGYSVEPYKYTKKNGETLDMFLVKFPDELDKEVYKTAKGIAKDMKGWASYDDGGFLLRSEEDANNFGKQVVSIVKNGEQGENNGANPNENEENDVSLLGDTLQEFNREKATLDQRDYALGDAFSLQEFVERQTFLYRYLWNDKGDTKGLRAHTGGKRGEMRAWLRYLSNEDGITPELAAHKIAQAAREAGFPETDFDEYDVLNMIIDAFLSFGSRKKVIEFYEGNRDAFEEQTSGSYEEEYYNNGEAEYTFDDTFGSVSTDMEPEYFDETDAPIDMTGVVFDDIYNINDFNNGNEANSEGSETVVDVDKQTDAEGEGTETGVGTSQQGSVEAGTGSSESGQADKPQGSNEGVPSVEESAGEPGEEPAAEVSPDVDVEDIVATYEDAKSNFLQNIILINDGNGNVYVTRSDLEYLKKEGIDVNETESNGEKYAVIPVADIANIMMKLQEDTFKMVPLNTGAAEKRRAMYDEAEKSGYRETMNELKNTRFTDKQLEDLIENNKRTIKYGEDEAARRYAMGSQKAIQDYLRQIDEENEAQAEADASKSNEGEKGNNAENANGEMQEVSMEEMLGDEGKEGETGSQEKPTLLTEEQINSIPLSDDFDEQDRALALDYINGNINEFTENSYNLATYYVGNQSNNSESNSGDEGAALVGTSATPGEGEQGNGGITEDGNVDNGNGEQDVQSGVGSGEDSTQDVPSAAGETGDSSVAGKGKRGTSSRGGKSGGSKRGRSNGSAVRSEEGQEGSSTDAPADATGNAQAGPNSDATGSIDDDIQSTKDEIADAIADLLDGGFVKFVAQPNEGDKDAMMKRAQAFKKIQRLVFKLAGLYLQKGYNKFEFWLKNMIAQLKQLGLDKVYDDDKIETLVRAAWDSPLVIDGVTKKVSEWAAELEKEELRKALNASREEKLKQQREAENVKVELCNLDNIRESLPYLLPAQQEDVYKAEVQFFDESHNDREHANGKGFLFTNGTGTGKTYTGLGIVKRFVKQGKERVLIVTPSPEKVNDWCKDGRNLGLDVESLSVGASQAGTTATKYKGNGVVCTTYSNLRKNTKILEDTFDLIIYDESHKIIENKEGEETIGADMHYMLSNRDYDQAMKRLESVDPTCVKFKQVEMDCKQLLEQFNKLTESLANELNGVGKNLLGETLNDVLEYLDENRISKITHEELLGMLSVTYSPSNSDTIKDIEKAVDVFNKLAEKMPEYDEWKIKRDYKVGPNGPLIKKAEEAAEKTKVVFLSATPFKGIDNLAYAESYIFKYPEEDSSTVGSYDHKSGMDELKLQHFSSMYKWRNHKAENSTENEEAAIKQQQAFADRLMDTLGTMSGRTIENGYDYSRTFPNADFTKAEEINWALEDIRRDPDMSFLNAFCPFNDYDKSSILFETMKVSAIIPRIKEYIEKGHKVLIYHRRVNMPQPTLKNPVPWIPGNPFQQMMDMAMLAAAGSGKKEVIEGARKAVALFMSKYSDLVKWADTLDYRLPVAQLQDALGKDNVGVFDGTVTNKVKHDAVVNFNNDESNVKVLVVNEDSGKEGISLHDTTGKHPRVLMSIALPQQSTTFIQVEGRIYRIGNMSDAIFEYPLLGINKEKTLFALKFNAMVGITENLALGSKARGLQRSIAKGVLEDTGAIPTDNQGKGGLAKDNAKTESDSFKEAIADYYTNQKNNKTRKTREGEDYYATPEPLGYKMVQWLQLNEGESMLEPSAGHGAIARYFPTTGKSLAIEPSGELFSKLALNTGGVERGSTDASGKKRLLMNDTFEMLETNNKFDTVVTNPPFGVAGATAIKHIEKSWKHLRNGGRMIAIIPVGAMDKKMETFLKENPNAVVTGEIKLPSVTFNMAGTSVNCRVIVIDKIDRPSVRRKAPKKVMHDLTEIKNIEEFFNAIKDIQMPNRVIDPMSKLLNHGEKFKTALAENKFVENKTMKDSKGNEKRNAKAGKNINVNEDGITIELGFPKKMVKNSRLHYAFDSTAYTWRNLRKFNQWVAKDIKRAVEALKIEDDESFMDAIAYTWYFEYKPEDVKEYRNYLRAWVDLHTDVSGFTEEQIINYADDKEDIYADTKLKDDAIYSLRDFESIVEDLTDNKMLLELSARVFAVAERFGVKVHTANNPNSATAGWYNLRSNSLEINSGYWNSNRSSDTENVSTIIHELIHACTTYALSRYETGNTEGMSEEMIDACKRITDLYNKVVTQYRRKITYRYDQYALTNTHEFLAELSQPGFREDLKKINLWTKIVDAIKRLFGIKDMPSEVVKKNVLGDVDNDATNKAAKKDGFEETNALKEAVDILDVFLDNPNVELFKKRNSDIVSFKVIDSVNKNADTTSEDNNDNTGNSDDSDVRNRKGNARASHTDAELGEMTDEVRRVADELNADVQICRDADELAKTSGLSNKNYDRMIANGKGVYILKSGKVVVYLPNHLDAKDAVKTVLHEIVGHKGLRQMVGEDAYDALLRKLYVSLPKSVRKEINRRAVKDYKFNIYEALDEYLAEKAELDVTPNWWYRAAAFVRQILRQLGINVDLSDNDVKYLLWQSKNQLRSGNVVDAARSKVMRARLGIGLEGANVKNRENARIKNEVKDQEGNDATDQEVRFSLRGSDERPFEELERRKVYKLMRLMPDGKLQTLYIGREDYELGKVYNADSPDLSMYENLPENFAYEITETREVLNAKPIKRTYGKSARISGLPSKAMVEESNNRGTRWVTVTLDAKGKRAYANVGINGAEGVTTYAMRPGIHAGNLPVMTQIGSGSNRDIRDDNLVFVEGEIAYGNGAPEEALENGGEITSHIPTDGGYEKGTSSFVTKGVTWYISGAFKPMRIISDDEARAIIDDFNKNIKEAGQPDVPYDYSRKGGRKFYTDTMRVEEDRDKNPKPPTPGGDNKRKLTDVLSDEDMSKNEISSGGVEGFVNRISNALGFSTPYDVVSNDVSYDELIEIGYLPKEANDVLGEISKNKNRKSKDKTVGLFNEKSKRITIFADEQSTNINLVNTIIHEHVHSLIDDMDLFDFVDVFSDESNIDDAHHSFFNKIAELYKDEPQNTNEEYFVELFVNAIITDKYDFLASNLSVESLQTINNLLNKLNLDGRVFETISGTRAVNGSSQMRNKKSRTSEKTRSKKRKVVDTTADGTNIIANANGYARKRYENMLKRGLYKLQEQWQDSMLGLKAFMQASMAAENKTFDDVSDFENPYMYENHMSSINNAECELFRNVLYQPLLDVIGKITGNSVGEKYDALKTYIVAKHGLERNDVFAMRDAVKKAKDELDYDKEISRIEKQYDAGEIDEDERDEKIKLLNEALKNLTDSLYEDNRMKDYSGLTALFSESEDDKLDVIEERAKKYVDDYEDENSEHIDDLWDRIRKCNKAIIDKQYECGMISSVTRDNLNGMFEYYVPLRGFDEQTSDDIYDYLQSENTPLNAPVKTAEGRKSLADDPIATIGNMAESGIVQANRNRLKEMFLRFVQNHKTDLVSIGDVYLRKSSTPQGDVWEFTSPEFDENDSDEDIKRKIQSWQEWFEEQRKKEPENYKKGREAANIPYRTLSKFAREHIVIVKRNGEDKVITINGNPRVAQAINGLTNPETVKGFTKVLASVSRMLARMNTTYSPAFVISNLFRDGIYSNSMVWVKEGPGYAYTYNKNWSIALANCGSLIRKYNSGTLGDSEIEQYFKEFIENGGETGQTRLNDVDAYKGIINKAFKDMSRSKWNPMTALESVGGLVEFSNRWAEDTSRFAAYMTSRQMGRSVLKSVHDAKEISVNFNKKGAGSATNGKNNGFIYNLSGYASQQARALYMFFNAGVQGLANITKAAKKNPGKFTALTSTFFACGALQPLMNQILVSMMGGDDDDDYYNIPEYVRRQNFCIFAGNGYVKIPLPIELRAIFGMGELASGQVMGGTKYNATEVMQRVAEQFGQLLPLDFLGGQGTMEFVPSALRPVYEIEKNVDWTGLPIYKEGDYMKSAPGWCKAYSKTNPLLVDLCMRINDATNGDRSKYGKGAIDINPAVLEHLLDGYLGGVGTFFKQAIETGSMVVGATDLDMRRVPIASRFFMQTDDRMLEKRDAQKKWFDAKDEADDIQYEFRMLKKDAATEDSEYALREIHKLVNKPEFVISEVFKEYNKGYRDLKDAEKAGADVKDIIIDLQRNFVHDADSIRKDFEK